MFPLLLAHLWGDYILQNDWMVRNKTSNSGACAVHVLMYGIPFLFIMDMTASAWLVIVITHFIIDRYRLARYVIYARNRCVDNYKLKDSDAFGFRSGTPEHISFFVCVLVDNTLHLTINYLAYTYL